ncbi:MAG: NAD(P)H-hydrate dehydratase [Alphaproteobacteria bacterium]|nr:NAD(P)H-hydrate dehydratase [Alphaproteobacteria bacterium]
MNEKNATSPQVNAPSLWQAALPKPDASSYKYSRGHAVVQGGGAARTGAAKLAARAALRVGAGAVTVVCDERSLPIYAASFQAIMTRVVADDAEFASFISDERITALCIGPAAGITLQTKVRVLSALRLQKAVVLDADALSVFAENPDSLFEAIQSDVVLTPHEGEFVRLFHDVSGSRAERAIAAAKQSGAVVLYKGAETLIAAPDGRLMVNRESSSYLATAGSGDVLAGILTGLLAGGMDAFDAACAATWIHGKAAQAFGAGLIADDIPDLIPPILNTLHGNT